MKEDELLNYLSSIDEVSNLKIGELNGGKCAKFIFRNFIEVTVDIDVKYALISINFKTKLFKNGKIKEEYVKWISKILNYDENTMSVITIVNVGQARVFNLFLSEELLEKLPIVLNAFIDNFLPTIQPYVKDDFEKLFSYDEPKDENVEIKKIPTKEIYEALSSIEGVSDIGELRESDHIEFTFVYQNHLEMSLSLEFVAPGFVYLTFNVDCHAKPFSFSKINKKLEDWALSIVAPYDKSNLGIVSADTSEYGYTISLSNEMLPALKELLEGFEKDFLPSIQDLLK